MYGELTDEYQPSFENYPFIFAVSYGQTAVMTPEAGTYAIKIETVGYEATDITPEFETAVKAVGGGMVFATFKQDYDNSWSCDKTFAELKAAHDKNFPVLAKFNVRTHRDSGWYQMDYDDVFFYFHVSQGWLDGPNTGVLYFGNAWARIDEDNTVTVDYSRFGVTYSSHS